MCRCIRKSEAREAASLDAEHWTWVLWKSSMLAWPLKHLAIPVLKLLETGSHVALAGPELCCVAEDSLELINSASPKVAPQA